MCCIVLIYIFSLVSFAILFPLFLASDVKPIASRTFDALLCEKFWLSAFNSRADNTVINYCKSFCKFKACCLLSTGRFLFSQLLLSQFPCNGIFYYKVH